MPFGFTANLDGETHLKKLECVSPSLLSAVGGSPDELVGVIECEPPHPDLYKFHGRMTVLRDDKRLVCAAMLTPLNQ